MATIQTIVDCVEICYRQGIKDVVLCPGSRNAALIVAFEQHPEINCYSISDERSAAFIAMGIAISSRKMVAIVCTSGTAALNFAPAVAEAFFQEIPLLVLTADRPPEWINQYDGQTIFQTQLFGPHVKKAYQLLPDYEKPDVDWFAQRSFNEAIICGLNQPQGPVHINIPIREPFYPENSNVAKYSDHLKVIEPVKIENKFSLPTEIEKILSDANSVMILVGQQRDNFLSDELIKYKNNPKFTVIGDSISNVDSDIKTQDVLFKNLIPETNPDVLITCGKSFISKNLKLYFRKNKVKKHIHVQESATIYDPLQSVTHWINTNPTIFFKSLFANTDVASAVTETYKNELVLQNNELKNSINERLKNLLFSDISFVATLLPKLSQNAVLHAGNSLSIRYVNILLFLKADSIQVYCNRGTSGIEGSLSTAVGHALKTKQTVYCLLGDVSFQYDKNALWNNYLPANLKIVILNNKGGNIFRMIPGPKSQTAYKTYFETEQRHSASLIAKEFGLLYYAITSSQDFSAVDDFNAVSNAPAILEVFTEPEVNESTFKSLFT